MSEPTYSTSSEAREAQLLHAAEAVVLLNDLSERRGFAVRRREGSLLHLYVRAASMNAADWLRSHGIDATANRTNNGWVVKVWS